MSKRQKIDGVNTESASESDSDSEIEAETCLSPSEASELVEKLKVLTISTKTTVDESEQTWAIDTLWKINQFLLGPELSHDSSFVHSFYDQSGADYSLAICSLMKSCVNNPELHKNALLSVSLLCRANVGEKNISLLFEHAIDELLGQSMRKHRNEPAVQQFALNALANMVTGSESRKNQLLGKPCDAGVAIFEALKLHASDTGVQHAGLLAMGTLCSGNLERKSFFLQHGGIEAILYALKTHSAHPGVQGQGIMAASNLSASNDFEDASTQLLKANFDTILMNAFENHPNDPEVHSGGLTVASHMCKLNSQWRSALTTKQFPWMIIATLDRFQHANIQLWGLVALSNIALVSDNVGLLKSASEVSSMVESEKFIREVARVAVTALTNHPYHAEVVGQAFATIGHTLTLQSKTMDCFKQQLIEMDIISILVNSLRTSDRVEVVKYGLFAAGQLVNQDHEISFAFKNIGIVKCITNSLQKFEQNSMIGHFACSLIYYLLVGCDNDVSLVIEMKENLLPEVLERFLSPPETELSSGVRKWASLSLEIISSAN